MARAKVRKHVINDLIDAILDQVNPGDLRLDEEEDYRERAACWEQRNWPEPREARKMYRHVWRVTYHRLQVALCAPGCNASEFEAAIALDAARERLLKGHVAAPEHLEEEEN